MSSRGSAAPARPPGCPAEHVTPAGDAHAPVREIGRGGKKSGVRDRPEGILFFEYIFGLLWHRTGN